MKVLFCQPSSRYYAWQCETLLQNLLELNFNLNDVEVVCSGNRNEEFNKLAHKYAARFFFYPYTANSIYPSIARPNALKQYFRQFPEFSKETILYVDCDILFLQSPSIAFNELLADDIVYMSDTKWYTGYSYLKSKESHVTKNREQYETDTILKPLCDIVGIDLQTVKDNDDHSGGAQYLLKGVDSAFWEDVERTCDIVYKYFAYHIPGSINNTYFNSEVEGFQSFALGDMLGVLWNLWKRGKTTRISDKMNFAWPGYSYEDKDRFTIYHNSGVCNDNERMFYKAKYMNSIPYADDFDSLDKSKLSYFYTEKIIDMKNKTCLT